MGSDYFPSEVCRRLITVESIESVEVIVVGAVSLSIGGIRITESSSVGSVSREGVVVAQVLSIGLRFGLSLSFSLEDTTVVEVVEVRAVGVSSGVRISSISSGVRISSVSRIGVVVKLSVSLGFSLSLTFTKQVMGSWVSVNGRLIDMIEGVDGIGVCWGLNLDLFGQVVSERHGRDVRVDYFFGGSIIVSGVFGRMMLKFGSFDAVCILRNDSSIVMLDKSSGEMLSLGFGNNRKDKEGSKNLKNTIKGKIKSKSWH